MRIELELEKMGFTLPTPRPVAAYIPAVRTGNLVFTAGQGPTVDGKPKFTGNLGRELTEEQGYQAAQSCAVNCLACVKSVIGDYRKEDDAPTKDEGAKSPGKPKGQAKRGR